MSDYDNGRENFLYLSYENFVCYFENNYICELSSKRFYEERVTYLQEMKSAAISHRHLFELRHGQGSYQANLGKYGSLNRTPLQIIDGELHCTHLLMPKIAHTYFTGLHHRTRNNRWFDDGEATAA